MRLDTNGVCGKPKTFRSWGRTSGEDQQSMTGKPVGWCSLTDIYKPRQKEWVNPLIPWGGSRAARWPRRIDAASELR